MALEGLLKWRAGLLALCGVGCALGGCASTPTRGAETAMHAHWLSGYVFGIWGKADLDVRDDCPNTGAASVRIAATWTTLAATIGTLGIYTPREVHVQCRARAQQ